MRGASLFRALLSGIVATFLHLVSRGEHDNRRSRRSTCPPYDGSRPAAATSRAHGQRMTIASQFGSRTDPENHTSTDRQALSESNRTDEHDVRSMLTAERIDIRSVCTWTPVFAGVWKPNRTLLLGNRPTNRHNSFSIRCAPAGAMFLVSLVELLAIVFVQFGTQI